MTDLREVTAADVHKAGELAGQLTRDGDDVVFGYVDGYAGPPVAVTLPVSTDEVRATAGAVPPFFAGLLPEGARLQALTTGARTSTDDQLTLLLLVGADAIGDVQVVPAGEQPRDPEPLLDPAGDAELDFDAVFRRATSPDAGGLDRIALPGVQVKASAAVVSTPVGTTAGPAILKLDPSGWPHLVANEHFFLAMAADCGIPVPEHRLLHDTAGRAGLLVTRFDRVPGPPRRLAQEDACQVLGRYPAAKYRISLQEAALALARTVEDGGGSRPLAVRRVLEVAAFSYLIGNGDLHGKNLSVRQTVAGLWELTPAYDLLCTQPYASWSDPMALDLYGRGAKLARRWWLDAADRLGVPRRAVERSLDRITASAGPWIDRLGDIGFDDAATERLAELLRARRAELRGS